MKPISALHIDTHPHSKHLLRRCCNCVLIPSYHSLNVCHVSPCIPLFSDWRICLKRDARINYGESGEILLISSLRLLLLLLSQYWVMMPQRTTPFDRSSAWNVMWLIRKKEKAGKRLGSFRHRFDYRINKQRTRNGMANNWHVMDAFYCIIRGGGYHDPEGIIENLIRGMSWESRSRKHCHEEG